MNFNRTAAIALLACAGLLVSAVAEAQARGPRSTTRQADRVQAADTPAAREAKLADLEEWLRRLVGRFQVKVSFQGPQILEPCGIPGANLGVRCSLPNQVIPSMDRSSDGSAECRAVGAGSGVNCLLNYINGNGVEVFEVILYGLDPDDPGIRIMHVPNIVPVRMARGSLSGDAVTIRTECFGWPPSTCTETTRIHAPPGGRPIRMTIESRAIPARSGAIITSSGGGVQFEWLRLPQRQAGESSAVAPE